MALRRLAAGEKDACLDVVRSLQQRLFAVIRVSSVESSQLQILMRSWQRFFEDRLPQEKLQRQVVSGSGLQRVLSGYNRVNAAKEVFRIRRDVAIPFPQYPQKLASSSWDVLGLLERVATLMVNTVKEHLMEGQGRWSCEESVLASN